MTIHWKPWRAVALIFTALSATAPFAQAQDKSPPAAGVQSAPAELPDWVRRGLPGAGHAAIAHMVGGHGRTIGCRGSCRTRRSLI